MIEEKNTIYKCKHCGNMVEAVRTGAGELVCCGEAMELVNENTQEDVATEKHIPVVEKDGDVLSIIIGSVEHPMEEDHYIEWVEVISGPTVHRRYLKPGDEPKTKFVCRQDTYAVRAHCNIHGLWSTK